MGSSNEYHYECRVGGSILCDGKEPKCVDQIQHQCLHPRMMSQPRIIFSDRSSSLTPNEDLD